MEISKLIELLTNQNSLPVPVIILILLVLIILCITNIFQKDPFNSLLFNATTAKTHRRNDINVEFLELLGELYTYVKPLTNLKAYTPAEALDFKNDIEDIIRKKPYFSTDLLEDLLLNLDIDLKEQNPDYRFRLRNIRSYIINQYFRSRKHLGYPTASNSQRFSYTSHNYHLLGLFALIACETSILFYILTYLFYNLSYLLLYFFSALLLFSFAIVTFLTAFFALLSYIHYNKDKKKSKSKLFPDA